jgi:two-component system, chemotaxis family, chemotaxis protein CheY
MSVWRVLLVDDSALIRNAMHAALEPYGLELVHAENGQIAVDRARSSRWDLIFLDVVMPVMDGPSALRQIRAAGNTTPVVLVTSVSTAATVSSAIKLGGVSYIGKPFTPDQIRAVAGKMLKLGPAVLPQEFDEAVVRDFLYRNFLLPLVVIHGRVAHAAGFRGPPAHLPAYIAMLSRALIDRCGGLDQTTDLVIDLTRMPDEPDAVVSVIRAADRGLREAGASPAFRMSAEMQDATAARLAGVLLQRA